MASISISGWGVDRSYSLSVTESSYNAKTNTSVVSWTLTASGGSTWYDYYLYASVNGTQIFNDWGNWSYGAFPAATGSKSGTMTITHNSGGDKSISFYIEGYAYQYSTKSASGSLTLTKLDRTAPKVTSGSSSTYVSNITINSFKIKVNSDVTCSQWAYKIKKSGGSYGSWVYANSSAKTYTFTVSSLAQNTSYIIQLAGKKSTNDVWGYTSEITVKTLGASTITSVSNVTLSFDGTVSSSVVFTPLVSTFKYKIKFTVGTYTWTTDYILPNQTTAYTHVENSFDVSLANYLTTAAASTCTCTLTTYDANNNQVGSANSKTFTVTVPSTMVPVIDDLQIIEAAPVSGFNRYAKTLSKPQVNVWASGVYNSTVSKVYVTIDNIQYEATEVKDPETEEILYYTVTGNTLISIGEKSVVVRVVDSRTKEVLSTNNITVYDYFQPSGSFKIQMLGMIARVEVTGKVAPVDNQNDFTVTITRTQVDDPSDTETVVFTPSEYDFVQAWAQTIPDIATSTYEYTVVIEDEKHNKYIESQRTAIVTISRLRGGRGVTLFQEATKEGFWVRDVNYDISTETYQYLASRTAKTYSSYRRYKEGTFVLKDGEVYEAKEDINFPETFTPSKWEKVSDFQFGAELIPYPYYDSSKTSNGITWTINDDGSVTASGTSTADSSFLIRARNNEEYTLPVGIYKFVGCPPGGNFSDGYYVFVNRTVDGAGVTYDNDIGDGIVFEVTDPEAATGISLRLRNGVEVNGLRFYPSLKRIG